MNIIFKIAAQVRSVLDLCRYREIVLLLLSFFLSTAALHAQEVPVDTVVVPLKQGYFSYEGNVYPSVGNTYRVEYDTSAFSCCSKIKYDYPAKVAAGLCGADSGTAVYDFKPRKTGVFEIVEIFGFRGEETNRIRHRVVVKK